MGMIQKQKKTIPLNQLEGMDHQFFRQIQMSGDKVLKKFRSQYDETKNKLLSMVTAEGIYASYEIEKIENDVVYLKEGQQIHSKMLAQVFTKSDELIFFAATVSGYDELEKEGKDFMETFFYDGWGTAVAECGSGWLKKLLAAEMEKKQRYLTCAWSPGQHNVDIKFQRIIFDLLKPEEIGITLNESYMMQPKKSVSGFIGLGRDKDVELIRACDFCERRETCPSAYAT